MTPAQVQKARQGGEDEPPPSRCVETAPTGGGASPQRFYTRLRDRVVRRSLRPNFAYVFREALGLNDVSGKFVYVTDGGHFDNLGLVELLRRGCGRIVCFDAAGDALGEYFVLSDAMALARSDLGVEIDINLSPLKPDEKTGISPSDHAVGTIRYPDGVEGKLIYVKAALPKGAPPDVLAYREKNRLFPTQSTLDQLFDEPQFESYRALGAHAATSAVKKIKDLGLI